MTPVCEACGHAGVLVEMWTLWPGDGETWVQRSVCADSSACMRRISRGNGRRRGRPARTTA